MNIITGARQALKLEIAFRSATPLLLRSGQTGDITDSSIEKTPDGRRIFVNGYVWASLFRRCLVRLLDGRQLAEEVGSYHRQSADGLNVKGISPLWCEQTTADLHATAVNPGISIERQWGATKSGALFHDELAMAGLPLTLRCTVLVPDRENGEKWRIALLDALALIHAGVENIGGGWTYGYGRLHVEGVKTALLDLTTPTGRELLWSWDDISWQQASIPTAPPRPAIPATCIAVRARVAEGQILAIKSNTFPLDAPRFGKLPDSFVFRRNRLVSGGQIINEPVIPGKAIRQALLSAPLERKWRSIRKDDEPEVCLFTTHGKPRPPEKRCPCPRCRWFGSTDAAGVIAVTDAAVTDPSFEVLSRVQLCEHSMQNMNLFSSEYLTNGNFDFRIIIDHARAEDAAVLVGEITALLDEMRGLDAPPGWYRLGGTATCTGQVQVIDYTTTRS